MNLYSADEFQTERSFKMSQNTKGQSKDQDHNKTASKVDNQKVKDEKLKEHKHEHAEKKQHEKADSNAE